jgi:predicted DCC family thiol-disulfide oxidoreductase YuxK
VAAVIDPAPQTFEVELFFDGACPLCAREVRWLRRLDAQARVRFTDIALPSFDPSVTGRPRSELMASLHARLPDGTWLTGVDSFRAVYAAVGLRRLVALSRLAPVSWALERGYAWFARNRLRLTGRCEADACAAPGPARPGGRRAPDRARGGTAFEAAAAGAARVVAQEAP